MCDNPLVHPELLHGEPLHRKALSTQNATTLCGKHVDAPTLESALAGMGLDPRTIVVGAPSGALCGNCLTIHQRLN